MISVDTIRNNNTKQGLTHEPRFDETLPISDITSDLSNYDVIDVVCKIYAIAAAVHRRNSTCICAASPSASISFRVV